MPYSKRWELVHLLGGKCVDCENENFYDLEIDHINNDGDGERKYYTLSEKNYLDNPKKAKDRLAVRCKKCHEKRHHSSVLSEIIPIKGKEISVCPSKDGIPISHGSCWLGEDIKEILIVECKDFQATKILRIIKITEDNEGYPISLISRKL